MAWRQLIFDTDLDAHEAAADPHPSYIQFDEGAEVTLDVNGDFTQPSAFAFPVDTYLDAASDNIRNITRTASAPRLVVIRPANDARTIVVEHDATGGNVSCVGQANITLNDIEDFCFLFYDDVATRWYALSGGGGGPHGTSQHTAFNNWKMLYTDGAGDQQELALAALGNIIQAAGTAAAPTMSPPWVASATQTVVAATAILANAVSITIDAAANVTMTAEPTIADGADGQQLTIINVDTVNEITLQDRDGGLNTNLRLGAATRVLKPHSSIELVYSTDIGAWVEQHFVQLVELPGSLDSFTVDGLTALTRQVGDGVTTEPAPAFVMAYTGTPSSAQVDLSGGEAGYPYSLPAPYTSGTGPVWKSGSSVGAIRTFTPTAIVNGDPDSTPVVVATFLNTRYAGAVNQNTELNDVQMKALAVQELINSRTGSFAVNAPAGDYMWFCFRSALTGAVYFSINGERAGFNLVTSVHSHTNDSNFVENFKQYCSVDAGMGNRTLVVAATEAANRRYAGSHATATGLSDAEILAITDAQDLVDSRYGSFAVSAGATEYVWLCYPARLGTVAIFKVSTGERVGVEAVETADHKNQWGYTESYYRYRMTDLDLGTFTLVSAASGWQNRQYWGISTVSVLSEAQILALSGSDLDEDVAGAGFGGTLNPSGANYVHGVFPSRLTAATIYLKGGSYIAGVVENTAGDHDNAYGYREAYRRFRSANTGMANQAYTWSTTKPVNRRFAGDQSASPLTSAQIIALAHNDVDNSRYETIGFTVTTTAGEYVYFCYRATLGNTSMNFSLDLERAGFTEQTEVSVTNAQGYTENFKVWRSDITNPSSGGNTFRCNSVAYNNRFYIGPHTNATETIGTAEILTLDDTADGTSKLDTSPLGTYSVTITSGEYLWICWPASWSDPSAIKDNDTGFAIDGAYRDTISHTNDKGYTENYRCWRSTFPNIFPAGGSVLIE